MMTKGNKSSAINRRLYSWFSLTLTKNLWLILAVACLGFSSVSIAQNENDEEIKQKIITESTARYSGSCPCPYNRDRAGRSCGKRSAYSRPGGASPICYPSDVTEAMIKRYRARNS